MGNLFSSPSAVPNAGPSAGPSNLKKAYRGLVHVTTGNQTHGEEEEAKQDAKVKTEQDAKVKAEQDAKVKAEQDAKEKCLQDPTYRFPTPKKDEQNPNIIVDSKKTDLPHQIAYISSTPNIENIVFKICYEWAGNKLVIDSKLEGKSTAMDFAFTYGFSKGGSQDDQNQKACNIIKYLIAAGATIDATDEYGDTPLHKAVVKQEIDLVNHIIKAGAIVDIKNKGENTPLIIAINKNNLDIVTALIDNKADVNKKDKHGKTPLDIARYNNTAQDKDTQNKIIDILRKKGAQATTWLGGSSKRRKTTKRKSNKKQRKTKRNKKST